MATTLVEVNFVETIPKRSEKRIPTTEIPMIRESVHLHVGRRMVSVGIGESIGRINVVVVGRGVGRIEVG